MKNLLIAFLFAAAAFSCTSQKGSAAAWKDYTITSPCPPNSECSLKITDGKSLLVKADDTGHIYYNLEDAPGKIVVIYTYRTITDPKLQDAGYSESVIFETDGKAFNYADADMQNTKMLFNVQCFCRGKAGLRKIEQGKASYNGKNLHLEIPGLVEGQVTKIVDITKK